MRQFRRLCTRGFQERIDHDSKKIAGILRSLVLMERMTARGVYIAQCCKGYAGTVAMMN